MLFNRSSLVPCRTNRALLCLLLLPILFQAATFCAEAQSATATLSGVVKDQNNAVLTSVNVSVISIAQGFQRSTVTNGAGQFVVPLLPPEIGRAHV